MSTEQDSDAAQASTRPGPGRRTPVDPRIGVVPVTSIPMESRAGVVPVTSIPMESRARSTRIEVRATASPARARGVAARLGQLPSSAHGRRTSLEMTERTAMEDARGTGVPRVRGARRGRAPVPLRSGLESGGPWRRRRQYLRREAREGARGTGTRRERRGREDAPSGMRGEDSPNHPRDREAAALLLRVAGELDHAVANERPDHHDLVHATPTVASVGGRAGAAGPELPRGASGWQPSSPGAGSRGTRPTDRGAPRPAGQARPAPRSSREALLGRRWISGLRSSASRRARRRLRRGACSRRASPRSGSDARGTPSWARSCPSRRRHPGEGGDHRRAARARRGRLPSRGCLRARGIVATHRSAAHLETAQARSSLSSQRTTSSAEPAKATSCVAASASSTVIPSSTSSRSSFA
jgi:hypothetical protein